MSTVHNQSLTLERKSSLQEASDRLPDVRSVLEPMERAFVDGLVDELLEELHREFSTGEVKLGSARRENIASQTREKSRQKRLPASTEPPILEHDVFPVSATARGSLVAIDCPVCQSKAGRPLYEVGGTEFRLATCTECGTGQLHPSPTASQIESFYPPVYYGAGGVKFSGWVEQSVRLAARWKVKQLTRGLAPAGRVLDIGCGRGTVLRAVADLGFEAHGLEISQTAVTGMDPRAHIRIAHSLLDAKYDPEQFDAVILWHVLEHLPNPAEILAEVRRILKPGGRLHVSVPNFSSWQSRWSGPSWFHLDLPRHLFHFPSSALTKMLEDQGFHVVRTRHASFRQNPYGWLQSAMNRFTRGKRNRLYSLLKKGSGSSPDAASSAGARWKWLLTAAVLTPFACAASLLEVLFRQGGTVHMEAVRD